MVFSNISSEDDIMPSHFFPGVLKLNTDGYVRVLSEVVKPWIDHVVVGRLYVWQQDLHPVIPAGRPRPS